MARRTILKHKALFTFLLSLFFIPGCYWTERVDPLVDQADQVIHELLLHMGTTHGQPRFQNVEVLEANIELETDRKTVFQAKLYIETQGERIKIVNDKGTVALFDGKQLWVSPSSSSFPKSKFHLQRWARLLTAPYKAAGFGATLSHPHKIAFKGNSYWGFQQQFKNSTLGFPFKQRTYLLDPESGRLEYLKYIPLGNARGADPYKNLHYVALRRYREQNGLLFPFLFELHEFDERKGNINQEPFARLYVNKMLLTDMPDTLFFRPADARKI